MSERPSFGVGFSGNVPVRSIVEGAQLADQLGWDYVFLAEDYFFRGGIAMATAAALAPSSSTSRTVAKLPSRLAIFSPLTRRCWLWHQMRTKRLPVAASDWAISFSWCGKMLSTPPQ